VTDLNRAAAELAKREAEDRETDPLLEPCRCGNPAYAALDNEPCCDLHASAGFETDPEAVLTPDPEEKP
jgi:CDGSH-type Zn-finger protein